MRDNNREFEVWEGGEIEMIIIFLLVTTVVSLIGWLSHWVGTAALAKYMMDKGYTPPSDGEMKACCSYVWRKLLHLR